MEGMTRTILVLLSFACGAIFATGSNGQTTEHCARLHFQGLSKDSSVQAVENTLLEIRFRLIAANCPEPMNVLYIFKTSKPLATCIFKFTSKGSCIHFQGENCSCSKDDEYVYKALATRHDAGVWTWRTPNKELKATKITVNVKYPPKVTDLSITPGFTSGADEDVIIVQPSTQLSILCKWEIGNPVSPRSTDVKILDITGTPLKSRVLNENNAIEAFHNASCEDKGNITCDVPAASKTRTVELAVECPSKVTGLSITPNTTVKTNPKETSILVENDSLLTVICHWEINHPILLDASQITVHDFQGRPINVREETYGKLTGMLKVDCTNKSGNVSCLAPGASENKTVFVDVRCPPKVTLLFITPNETKNVAENVAITNHPSNLLVTCGWEKGHPTSPDASQVALLDAQGKHLQVDRKGDEEIHAMTFAECGHSGNVTCLVPGASVNKTIQLLVRCGGGLNFTFIISVAAASLIAVVIVVALIVLMKKKRATQGQRETAPPMPHSIRLRQLDPTELRQVRRTLPSPGRESATSASSHSYIDIDDDEETGAGVAGSRLALPRSSSSSSDCGISNVRHLNLMANPSSESSESEGERGMPVNDAANAAAHVTVHPVPSMNTSKPTQHLKPVDKPSSARSAYLHPIASEFELSTPAGTASTLATKT